MHHQFRANSSSCIYGGLVISVALQLSSIKTSSAEEKFFMLYYSDRKLKQMTKFKLEL